MTSEANEPEEPKERNSPLKNQIMGGVIALLVTLIGAALIGWWNDPGYDEGIILHDVAYTNERVIQRDRQTNAVVQEYMQAVQDHEFVNVSNEIRNFVISLPVSLPQGESAEISTQVRNAVIGAVSEPSQLQTAGTARISVTRLMPGGSIRINLRTRGQFSDVLSLPATDNDDIQILGASQLHLYMN